MTGRIYPASVEAGSGVRLIVLLVNAQKDFGPQTGSKRGNMVVLVAFAEWLMKLGTVAHAPLTRLEPNSGTSSQVVMVPLEVMTMFVPTWTSRIVFGGGLGKDGAVI